MFGFRDAVDITTYHRGFHGDLNETFFVGAVSDKAKLLVQTTHECLAKAIAAGRLVGLLCFVMTVEFAIQFWFLTVKKPDNFTYFCFVDYSFCYSL